MSFPLIPLHIAADFPVKHGNEQSVLLSTNTVPAERAADTLSAIIAVSL